MGYSATIVVANRTEAELTVFVEPGGASVRLPAGGKLRVVAEADRAGEFDVDHSGEYMTVSAWPGAVARHEVEGGQVEAVTRLPGDVVARRASGERRPTYVSSILVGDNQVTLEAGPGADARALRALGGRRHLIRRRMWTFAGRDEHALGALLHALRDMGVAFAWAPSGWPPAAVFAHLRDRGLVEGRIRAVTWRSPGDFEIFEL